MDPVTILIWCVLAVVVVIALLFFLDIFGDIIFTILGFALFFLAIGLVLSLFSESGRERLWKQISSLEKSVNDTAEGIRDKFGLPEALPSQSKKVQEATSALSRSLDELKELYAEARNIEGAYRRLKGSAQSVTLDELFKRYLDAAERISKKQADLGHEIESLEALASSLEGSIETFEGDADQKSQQGVTDEQIADAKAQARAARDRIRGTGSFIQEQKLQPAGKLLAEIEATGIELSGPSAIADMQKLRLETARRILEEAASSQR